MRQYQAEEPILAMPTMADLYRELASAAAEYELYPEDTGPEPAIDQAAPSLKEIIAQVVAGEREKPHPYGLTKTIDFHFNDMADQVAELLPETERQALARAMAQVLQRRRAADGAHQRQAVESPQPAA